MKRKLKPAEYEKIVSAIGAGDRVKATNIYLSATEGNLTDARDSALSHARQRAGYGRCQIQVLDDVWNVVETIGNEELRPLV
jgi:hypothetical protein